MSTDTKPARILVADDDRDILELVSFRLGLDGHETILAGDGAEALEKAEHLVPDLCILDVLMPKLSGFEVLAGLRASEKTAHVPVIMLTASVQDRDVSRGFETGADDYVHKPFDPRELRARVQALLRRSQAQMPMAVAPG
jgi:DNA-binding response OmpR family regulator